MYATVWLKKSHIRFPDRQECFGVAGFKRLCMFSENIISMGSNKETKYNSRSLEILI